MGPDGPFGRGTAPHRYHQKAHERLDVGMNPERSNSTGEPSSTTYSRPRLLTAQEAAEWLAIRESTLRDLARRGIVPSVKIGRLMRFVEADLLAYVDGLRGS